MFTAFFIGNIASGKSTASRHLDDRGARRIDLDELAKALYVAGSPLVASISETFGAQVLDESGAIRASELAASAFATPEAAETLNSLVYPALLDELTRLLLPSACFPVHESGAFTVVEISNAASFTEAFGLADEVVAISAPLELRRVRACGRGMDVRDFDARAAAQPAEDELCGLADTVICNAGSDEELLLRVDEWAAARGFSCDRGSAQPALFDVGGDAHV